MNLESPGFRHGEYVNLASLNANADLIYLPLLAKKYFMQSFDYTTLLAIKVNLVEQWLPARIEQVYQQDRFTIYLSLRTLDKRGWLSICWHPEAARICISEPPPKIPDTFTFSDQLRHQVKGLALTGIEAIADWERVLDLQFAKRPGDQVLWHLYVEIMGKYSNVILTDAKQQIVAPAKQIGNNQSSVRSVQTGQPYEIPPPLTGTLPKLEEPQASWQERVSLVPGKLQQQLLHSYRGVSPKIATEIITSANLSPQQITTTLEEEDWQNLYKSWLTWLEMQSTEKFTLGKTDKGYTVLGLVPHVPVKDVQQLIDNYYRNNVNQRLFQQLHHQLKQKVANVLKKSDRKANTFRDRLKESTEAEFYRQQADLLMAHLHLIKPGMLSIELNDFETNQPLKIKLNPEKNPVQNAQAYYKIHQKLKRAQNAVIPLLTEVETEISYLQQVKTALNQLANLSLIHI